MSNEKIHPEHLRRPAFVYVRQSTFDQVRHHHESRRRQYDLEGHARHFGWAQVIVIDEDQSVDDGDRSLRGPGAALAALRLLDDAAVAGAGSPQTVRALSARGGLGGWKLSTVGTGHGWMGANTDRPV
jgi:hypothetical protein